MSSQNITYLFLFMILVTSCRTKNVITPAPSDMKTPFEHNDDYSASYKETVDYYQMLSQNYDAVKSVPFGMTDSGFPLHEVIIDKDKDFDPGKTRESGKTVLMINNAIHPGNLVELMQV